MKKVLLTVMGMLSLSGHAQGFFEGFESPWTETTAAPPGWTVVNQPTSVITWKQSTPNQPALNGNYAAFLDRETVAVTAAIPQDWLITPSFTVPANGMLQFYSRLTLEGDQGGIYKVLISTDQDATNLSAYTELYSATELQINPLQLTYTAKNVSLPPISGTARIAFVMTGNNADRWLIDDVSINSTCAAPSNVVLSDVTLNGVTVNWQENDTASQWEIEVLPVGSIPTGAGVVVNDMSYAVSNLPPGDFKVYVRSICSNGNFSAWSGQEFFTITSGKLSGTVTFDANGDDFCDNSDILAGLEVKISVNDDEPISVYTNANGEYALYGLGLGTKTISITTASLQGFTNISPVVQEVTLTNEITEAEINLCLPQPEDVTDLSAVLLPVSAARPGLPVTYNLVIKNEGSKYIENAQVVINYSSPKLDYNESDFSSVSVTENKLTIELNALAAYSSQSGSIQFTLKQPPVNNGEDVIYFAGVITLTDTDDVPENNNFTLASAVVNSFDPNDVTVLEGTEIYLDQADDYLTYVVRFQNTGNAEALRVRVTNTLDDLLDWDTFELIGSSHNNNVTRNGKELEFLFEGINLNFLADNEEESQGFLSYKIKPKAGSEIGDVFSNTAEIYFDFNEAIVTNTATTEIVAVLGHKENTITIATLYPNPVKDQLHVAVNQGELKLVTVHDINGRLCLSANATTVDTSALNSGIYFVKVTTDAGSANYKIIKQ